ncbi:hypothetical protein [Streptomyces gilvosporeus]|uniref:Uncharacterized protein n=1 Tax=Streptomyces gilvosporeus TaxID=553510 RepID=A0A1V0TQD3_9ACTN|nr:hypothetical protein [Streptomyces gilvosporeus]ARF55113.1 hypothetical protein B1H19_13680 [Streptomyces gilvosporeus]
MVPIGTFTPAGELSARSGVVPGGSPFALVSAGEMEATVGVGRAVIQGTAPQGAYPVAVTAPEPVTFAAGDAQFPRIDVVALRVYDDPYDSSGEEKAVLEVVQGDPAASPTAPTISGPAVVLWEVTVPAGASSGTGGINWATGVADRRDYTVAVGGIAVGNTPTAYAGQWRDYGGILERSNGTDWEPVVRLGYSGRLELGDASLYRSGAKTLATDQRFTAQVEKSSSYFKLQPGWKVLAFEGKKTCGIVHFILEIERTGAPITANGSGNIADETIVTIPSQFRPDHDVEAIACDGYADGGCRISPSGTVVLRTWAPNGTLTKGNVIRITPTYIL